MSHKKYWRYLWAVLFGYYGHQYGITNAAAIGPKRNPRVKTSEAFPLFLYRGFRLVCSLPTKHQTLGFGKQVRQRQLFDKKVL